MNKSVDVRLGSLTATIHDMGRGRIQLAFHDGPTVINVAALVLTTEERRELAAVLNNWGK